ncbi:MAG: hypothetical protein AB7K24_04735 [Gemmataceae bacterium]
MTTRSNRLAGIVAISLAAVTIMLLHAALASGRNPLLDAANLLPPALAFVLAGWLMEDRPALLTIWLIVVACLSVVCVLMYLFGHVLAVVIVWGLQWVTAFAALITSLLINLARDAPTTDNDKPAERRASTGTRRALLGFVSGVALGLALCFTIIRFEFHSAGLGGFTNIYVFGAHLLLVSGVIAELTQIFVTAVICGTAGILGAWLAVRRSGQQSQRPTGNPSRP